MGFSRQEYWSGLPFPSPEYLPDPGIKPRSRIVSKTLYRLSHQEVSICDAQLINGWQQLEAASKVSKCG